ncbi:DUF1559 domain-containing protein [Anatilimnocola floriformis]|uniref:DUF1559 domain-containing protein n=1 Tax=Anatilimnocola floriformis TaxID=2948575 RepID=UPI0020C41E55|nr:DUF1559 domain-containing protein [Anatilimnocola floriformis]
MRIRSLRGGFTLVELLVVIAIIGVLVALLLPAVQSAREASRRISCSNNMKQLALACLNYEDTYKSLPVGIQFPKGEAPESSRKHGPNWIISILPFMEQQPLFQKFDLTVPISHANNREPRGTTIKALLCPTDGFNRRKFVGIDANEGDNWARGNYGSSGLNWQLDSNANGHWGEPNITGVMGWNVTSRLAEVTDGLSQTLMLGELRSGLFENDRRGTWALGTAGASAMFWHGCGGDAYGPNAVDIDSDDVEGCSLFYTAGNALLKAQRMECHNGCPSYQAATRSLHPGGTVIGICDGSVQFISENIETAGNYGACTVQSAWDRLITREQGQPLKAGTF